MICFPLLVCAGDVTLDEATALVGKDKIIGKTLQIIWPIYIKVMRFLGLQFWLGLIKIERVQKLLNTGYPTGLCFYIPRDVRRRVYMLVKYGGDEYFVKSGKGISLDSDVPSLNPPFVVVAPEAKLIENDCITVVYKYLSNSDFKSSRLSYDESTLLVGQLNNKNVTSTVSLLDFINHSKSDYSEKVKVFLEKYHIKSDYPIELGHVHGDLMSLNIYRNSTTIAIIDWETYSEKMPIIIDLIGAMDWNRLFQEICNEEMEDRDLKMKVLAFVAITATTGFRPSRLFLEGIA